MCALWLHIARLLVQVNISLFCARQLHETPLPLAAVSVSAACPATLGHLLCQGARVLSESSHHGLQRGPVQQALLVLLQCRRGFHRHRLQYCRTALLCPLETVY
jgi:hypothetical protein